MIKNVMKVLLPAIILLFSLQAEAARKVEEVKAAYIYNFLKYIYWPSEDELEAFRIGFIGDDQAYLEACLLLQRRSVRNKALVVHQISDLNDIRDFQVIITSRDQNSDLPNIARVLYGAETLLISDTTQEKQLTMINFTYPDDEHVGFEVNRYNLLQEQLKVSSDILLLGGTELDIANLLRSMEQELANSQKLLMNQNEALEEVQKRVAQREYELEKQARELEKVLAQIQEKERLIEEGNKKIELQGEELLNQQRDLEQTQQSLDTLRNELNYLESSFSSSKERLESSATLLQQKQKEILDKESSIGRLSELIESNKALLDEQQQRIRLQAESIQAQEEALAEQVAALEGQRSTIRSQGNYLIGAIVTLAFAALVTLLVLRTNRVRKRANQKLALANEELEKNHALLIDAQDQLVESEKMASLGGLVAGVAHEINTPLGVSVTAVSHLDHVLSDFRRKYDAGDVKRSELEVMLDDVSESASILVRNLNRASELIGNFKQVATDQMVEELRKFDLEHYLSEVCQSLMPQLRPAGHVIQIDCPDIEMHTYPGALAQVITNLVMNSLVHGFDGRRDGQIRIGVTLNDDIVTLDYRDNGSGIPEEQMDKIFEPFFTTKRARGGTGLGMHISYNLVTQSLQGQISCVAADEGAFFQIRIPRSLKETSR